MKFTRVAMFGALALLMGCEGRTYDRMYGGQLGKAREAVRGQLKDPDSAKFSDVEVCKADQATVVGKVNSKNGFGAYAGDDLFFVHVSYVQFYRDVLFDDFARKCYGTDPIWADYLKAIPNDLDRLQSASGAIGEGI